MADITATFSGGASSTITADTGQVFTNFGGGAIGTDGSGHATVTAATGEAGNYADSGSPDATASVAVVNAATTSGGLVFRYQDGSNFWVCQMVGSVLYTRKYVAGVYTDYTNSLTWSDGDVISVVCSGTSITVKQNSTTVRTLTDSFNQSATKWGMLARPGALYDNFSVANAASGATPTKLAFVTQPGNGSSTNVLAQQPVVQIQDASSVLVTSATNTVTVTLVAETGSGTFMGTANKAAVAGSASWTDLAVLGSGTFHYVATSPGLTQATSASFSISLRSSSPYLGLSADGSDLGATVATITAMTAVALSGDRRSVTEPRRYAGALTYNGVTLANYPNEVLDTDTFPTRTGTLRNVNGDAAFLAALTAAVPGDWIIVDNASTYTADYTNAFPFKAGDTRPGGNNVIVVMAKAIYDSIDGFTGVPTFCPPKKRITDSDHPSFPRFINSRAAGSFQVAGATRGWRFVGLTFEQDPAQPISQHFVYLGEGSGAQTVSNMPVNIGLDRCYFKGAAGADMKHCVELHVAAGFVIDCLFGPYIKANVATYSESHCIIGYNGPGPFRIVNNDIVGGSQSIFFGGAFSNCGAPADIEARYNWCRRPLSWNSAHATYDGSDYAIKCGNEIKKAQRAIFEGNVVEAVWEKGQTGAGWLLKSESYGDGPTNGYTTDVIVMNNLTRYVSHGANIASPNDNEATTGPAVRVVMYNNIVRLGGTAQGIGGSTNPFVTLSRSTNAAIVKNTFYAESRIGQYIAIPQTAVGARLYNSIYSGPADYGWKPDAIGLAAAFATGGYLADATTLPNVVQGYSSADGYPSGTLFPANVPAIVYTDTSDTTTLDLTLYNASATPSTPTTSIVHMVRPVLRLAR